MRVRARAVLKWLIVVIALGYAGALALLYSIQGQFLYPRQTTRTAPAAANFAMAEELILDTTDGERVIAWHVPKA